MFVSFLLVSLIILCSVVALYKLLYRYLNRLDYVPYHRIKFIPHEYDILEEEYIIEDTENVVSKKRRVY